jgi:deoxycytidylate deaminase
MALARHSNDQYSAFVTTAKSWRRVSQFPGKQIVAAIRVGRDVAAIEDNGAFLHSTGTISIECKARKICFANERLYVLTGMQLKRND